MPSKFRFQENEKVLCYHGPLLYEAKCMKIQVKEKQVKYFVHYQGWNKSWDEWVPENRVLKCNESNIQRQKELYEAHIQNRQKAGKRKSNDLKDNVSLPPNITGAVIDKSKLKVVSIAANLSSNTTSPIIEPKESSTNNIKDISVDGLRKKRIRPEPNLESEDVITKKIDIKIKLTENLKQILVDDWDLITKQKKLFNLPARVTVDQILSDYMKHKSNTKFTPFKESAFNEIANAIKEYFNITLATQLLYKQERSQFQSQVPNPSQDDVVISSIYGFPHLLRLFVKLGGLLSYTNYDEKNCALLLEYIHDFVKYLDKNQTLFNLNDYKPISNESSKKN